MTDSTPPTKAEDDGIDAFATFDEWAGDADQRAYVELCDDR